MKSLKLIKNKYGIKVYCSTCRKQYSSATIRKCSHPETQTYRFISYTGNKQSTLSLTSKDFDDAVIEVIQIRREIKEGTKLNEQQAQLHDPNAITITKAANLYIAYKHGEGVLPQHEYKNRSGKDHKKALVYYIKQFIQVLEDNNFRTQKMPFSQISDKHIGYWYKFVTNHYGEGTWSTPISHIRPWFKHMRVIEKVKMIDPLEGVSFKKKENKIIAITSEQFYGVIDAIETKDKYEWIGCKGKSKKNMYRNWLNTAFRFGLFTGLRNAELVSLTWNDVHHNKKTNTYMIVTDNIKVEKYTGKKYKPKYIPCGPDLMDLLNEIGLDALINSDYYLISPHRDANHKTMSNFMSKAWTHYFKQAFPEKPPMPFKNLRKTYLSALNSVLGDDMIEFSSHSDMEVLDKHYLDPKKVAKGLEVRVFG